jgi:hypothetical protein
MVITKNKILVSLITALYLIHLYSMNQYRSDYFGDYWYFLGGLERRVSTDSLILGGISFVLFVLAFLAFRYSKFVINKFYLLPGALAITSLLFLYLSGQYVAVNCQECELSEYFNRIKIRSVRFDCKLCNPVIPKFGHAKTGRTVDLIDESSLISRRSETFFKQLTISGQTDFFKVYHLQDERQFTALNSLFGKFALTSNRYLLQELDKSAPISPYRSPIIP